MMEPCAEADTQRPSRLSDHHAPAITFLIGSLDYGGAEGQLIELLRRLDGSRWRTSLVLFEDATEWRADGVVDRVYSLGVSRAHSSSWRMRGWKAAVAITKLTALLLHQKADLLHAFLPASFVLAAPAGAKGYLSTDHVK